MIYVTGDMHGDISRFKDSGIKKLKKGDTLIVCGDFGFIWSGSRKERSILKKLGNKKYNIAFIDGCHENFDLLEGYEPVEWNGGKARVIYGNLVHLMRGQVFTIEGKKIFAFGGGHSHDFDIRRESRTWWEREQPTPIEINEATRNLKKCNNKIDYIVTHEPPITLKNCLDIDILQRLEVHTFFEDILHMCEFKKWYFGKCHINKRIPQKFNAVFDEIILME